MQSNTRIHPVLLSFLKIMRGKCLSWKKIKALNAICLLIGDGETVSLVPAKIAKDNKIDSLDVATVLGWFLEGGVVEQVFDEKGNLVYILSRSILTDQKHAKIPN